MFLDRIDIDAHGPLSRVELGPFSEHLNVVCGPAGSGKTAIARFIRDSLVHREYPLGMMSSSSGRVVWADRNGLVHCRREKDGTATGRRTVQFDPRGDFVDQYDSLQQSWISGITSSTDESRAAQTIQIPESIVDGVMTDTAVNSVARVVSACVRSGLDDPRTLETVPLHEAGTPEDHHRRRSLRAQLADVEAELARLSSTAKSHDQLVARRNELASKLATDRKRTAATGENSPSRQPSRAAELDQRAGRLRSRQSELRQSIADLDAEIARMSSSQSYSPPGGQSDEHVHRHLDDLDAQMIRWRRTLAEVHSLRDALARYVGDSGQSYGHGYFPSAVDEVAARRRQLDGLLHSGDRHERSAHYEPHHEASHRLTPTDIDNRIDAATRQIDWLLDRYAGDDLVVDWYRTMPASNYAAGATVAEALRAIRQDLTEIRQRTRRPLTSGPFSSHLQRSIHGEITELCQCERWLSASIDQLMLRRESLLHRYDPQVTGSRHTAQSWSLESLQRKRARRVSDLDRVTLDLNDCESRASHVRRTLKTPDHSYDASIGGDWIDRDAIAAELKHVDAVLASGSRTQWLRTRRSQLIHELGVVGQQPQTRSPLAEEASRWLVRLSAGRLRNVSWPDASFKSASVAHSIHLDGQRTGVCIDGRDESGCPAADRALTALAVRMAAGSLLAKTGRGVPLVLEVQHELLQATNVSSTPYASTFHDWDINGHRNHPITAALNDYARDGRQVVLLTSSQDVANQIHHEGGRVFRLFADRLVHGHRPIWRPHYAPERYVGPHPHTYGRELAPDNRVRGDETFHTRDRDSYRQSDEAPIPPTHVREHRIESVEDVNRCFDTAWREADGWYDNPLRSVGVPATDSAPDGVNFRDGYYVSNSYTTVRPAQASQVGGERGLSRTTQSPTEVPLRRDASPFFLSVDSPIDQAPSIDAVAAARLRGLKITHVNHLMQQDSNRLADALGLSNVDAATIRRWQSECRLCCRVPHLRGFDSRVLVGCGVTDPARLASIPPDQLLGRVESFLATEAGQRILRTGSSHELSRITTWIATARGSAPALGSGRVIDGKVIQNNDPQYTVDSDRDEYESHDRARAARQGRQRQYTRRPDGNNGRSTGHANGTGYGIVSAPHAGNGSGNGNGSNSGSRNGSATGNRSGNGTGRGSRSNHGSGSGNGEGKENGHASFTASGSGTGNRNGSGNGNRTRSSRGSRRRRSSERTPREYARADREPRQNAEREHAGQQREHTQQESRERRSDSDSELELRFYLQRESPVIDAPSIGARMAERLNEVGIETVDDLINADPESLAEQLDHRRADAETIEAWQHQATLVCRIPMLRGHDARLLVAAEYTTPEEVAESEPDEMFALIDPISRSSEGKRIIRGGKLPDLAEIKDWIEYAHHNRDLVAA